MAEKRKRGRPRTREEVPEKNVALPASVHAKFRDYAKSSGIPNTELLRRVVGWFLDESSPDEGERLAIRDYIERADRRNIPKVRDDYVRALRSIADRLEHGPQPTRRTFADGLEHDNPGPNPRSHHHGSRSHR